MDNSMINGWVMELGEVEPTITWIQSTQLVIKAVQNVQDTNLDYNVLAASYLIRM
jgi:hypothetical protein